MELYIHMPFCVRKCSYCAFDSFAGCSRVQMEQYTAAVLREARMRKAEACEPIETVYIGGGTPSLIPADIMESFLHSLNDILDLSGVLEFSVEANPGTVSGEWLRMMRGCGANRISLGMQAGQDHLLETLGRIHRFPDTVRAAGLARDAGFGNISLDLIFGIPGQTPDDWAETIGMALSMKPDHISAYGLIPEEGTPLSSRIGSGSLSLPDPDTERDMYDTAIRLFRESALFAFE